METFDAYFRRADLDQDGRISGPEAVAFLQLSNLPTPILAQIWMHADQNRTGFLGRQEFYNALRLVTVAQRGRELTPDIIKAALYSPAAAKIPAPQINPVSTPVAQMNSGMIPTTQSSTLMSSSGQMGVMGPSASQMHGLGSQPAVPNVGGSNFMRPPQSASAASLTAQGLGQGPQGGGSAASLHLPNSNITNLSTDWLGVRPASAAVTSTRGLTPTNHDKFGLSILGTSPGVTPNSQQQPPPALSTPLKQPPLQPASNNSKGLALSGNGFYDSVDRGAALLATSQAMHETSKPASYANSMPSSSSVPFVSAGSQNSIKPWLPESSTISSTHPPVSALQEPQPLVKQNQLYTVQSSPATVANASVGPTGSTSNQSNLPWPKITQSSIQNYTAVFVKVDKDRDGKISGQEARDLFMSWKLPREVLKQVWDLSDQDNDSMLSLREFCTALYLMERFREGRPLPAVLPDSLRLDETLLLATRQPSVPYAGPAWQPGPGLPRQGRPESRPVITATAVKPPIPIPVASKTDGIAHQVVQKSKVPILEKHLVNQLSKEEQSALNSKFQEASDADKKVQELEKEILESREKIEFYRTKMQELVLYKSKCDNRYNEIVERVSADKREFESLAKKYEAKYKQSGDVASKLTAEEATFRDIQEKKLELFNAIVKMEQGGKADDSLQVRVGQIQSDLKELVKSLNERCKQYGLRAKPTSLIELPFGWQPGIQQSAANWDEDWDSFEQEGFTVIKELTTEENITTAKPKSPPVQNNEISKDEVSPVEPSSDVDNKTEKPTTPVKRIDSESLHAPVEHIDSESPHAPSDDGSAISPLGSPAKSAVENSSQELHSTDPINLDMSPHAKESRIDHTGAESTISGDKSTDEPSWGATFDTSDDADSLWGFNPLNSKDLFGSSDLRLNSIKIDSPSASSLSGRKGPLFDSMPSTPLFNSGSPSGFSEGVEDRSFDGFSRFDSFSMHDSGLFPPNETLARFDSMRSERLTRFDSISSTADHNHGFPSFDDADPFGSSGPFKPSESHTPRRSSDSWSAF